MDSAGAIEGDKSAVLPSVRDRRAAGSDQQDYGPPIIYFSGRGSELFRCPCCVENIEKINIKLS